MTHVVENYQLVSIVVADEEWHHPLKGSHEIYEIPDLLDMKQISYSCIHSDVRLLRVTPSIQGHGVNHLLHLTDKCFEGRIGGDVVVCCTQMQSRQ